MTNNIPSLTVKQMIEVDRLMVNEVGIPILVMIENASKSIAALTKQTLNGNVNEKKIAILCGKGNNGGGGMGGGRHLINFGAKVVFVLAEDTEKLSENTILQLNILRKMNANLIDLPISNFSKIEDFINNADLIIDALIGYNLKGNPKEPFSTLINMANESTRPILAVDIPSGLSGDSGEAHKHTIRATKTLTLALPKVGLLTENAKEYVGELYLADLSVPSFVYKKLGIDVPVLFKHEEIVRIF